MLQALLVIFAPARTNTDCETATVSVQLSGCSWLVMHYNVLIDVLNLKRDHASCLLLTYLTKCYAKYSQRKYTEQKYKRNIQQFYSSSEEISQLE
jgi:hypothetical protein